MLSQAIISWKMKLLRILKIVSLKAESLSSDMFICKRPYPVKFTDKLSESDEFGNRIIIAKSLIGVRRSIMVSKIKFYVINLIMIAKIE